MPRIHDAGRSIYGTFAGWSVIPYPEKWLGCTWVRFSAGSAMEIWA
jgi:hypothetical protein